MRVTLLLVLFVFSFSSESHAAAAFNVLSQDDVDNVVREFSANSNLNNVMPASSMGSIFGFELGVTAGATKTPQIDAITKRGSPTTDASAIPHVGLLGAVTVPFGITAEVNLLPTLTTSDGEFSHFGAAVKWTMSFIPLINVALRGHVTKTKLTFKNTVNNSTTANTNVDTTVAYDTDLRGAHIMVSPSLPIVEPYAAFGVVSGKTNLSISAASTATSIFSSGTQSAESSPTSTDMILGVNLRLLIFVVGAEYERAFGTDTYTGKLSLRF